MTSSVATKQPERGPEVPAPRENEKPTSYCDRIGRWYAAWTPPDRKRFFGQYLTPVEMASFMAGLFLTTTKNIRMLDPGAGAGVLSCAVLEALAAKKVPNRRVYLEVYESDVDLAKYLEGCLIYASKWLNGRGMALSFKICTDDFILTHSRVVQPERGLFDVDPSTQNFDLIISNPPYFKIPKSDVRAKAVASIVHGQPNIYMLFMATSAALLRRGGELVFITPRSYAAGPYFRRFREVFFSIMKPETIHLFGSRTEAFGKDDVLQESVILHARRQDGWAHSTDAWSVRISHTKGVRDLALPTNRNVPLGDILDVKSKDKILRIPIATRDDEVSSIVKEWTGNLHAFGMEISTGPVVPFRATPFIYSTGRVPTTHAPLLWMQNVTPMQVRWPKDSTKKAQFIIVSAESLPLLIPVNNYVFLRRFSAKEERRRLVAAPFLANVTEFLFIGVENHLNYIYRPKGSLTDEEAHGLAALLNSQVLDFYFRIFNGNTQVSATELRNIRLPALDLIRRIGIEVMNSEHLLEEIDPIVAKVLNIDDNFAKLESHV